MRSVVVLLLALGASCGPSTDGSELGDECAEIRDCNDGQTCGDLIACVHGYCLRDQPTVHKPCGN
jgi:hypothetical protein